MGCESEFPSAKLLLAAAALLLEAPDVGSGGMSLLPQAPDEEAAKEEALRSSGGCKLEADAASRAFCDISDLILLSSIELGEQQTREHPAV